MNKLSLLFLAVLTGCTTAVPSGKQKLLGLIPIPFTGNPSATTLADPDKALMIDQLAPFVYVSLFLIVGGAFTWWATSGKTGLGKCSIFIGVGLALFATIMPQIAGWIGLIAIVAASALMIYFVWWFIQKRKEARK